MKWIKFFIFSAGATLLIAAIGRILISMGDAQSLSLLEPFLGLPLRYTVLLLGGLELLVALMCLFGRQTGLQLSWLAWLATSYHVYWIGLYTMNIHPQATCIGSLTDPLYLSRGTSGVIVQLIPIYLFLGSYAGVAWFWLADRRVKSAKYLKMSCPACGVHIRFDDRNLGQRIPCPHCQEAITLSHADAKVKGACFFCKGHIEFPAHALGEKMPCPHCKMDITLKEPA